MLHMTTGPDTLTIHECCDLDQLGWVGRRSQIKGMAPPVPDVTSASTGVLKHAHQCTHAYRITRARPCYNEHPCETAAPKHTTQSKLVQGRRAASSRQQWAQFKIVCPQKTRHHDGHDGTLSNSLLPQQAYQPTKLINSSTSTCHPDPKRLTSAKAKHLTSAKAGQDISCARTIAVCCIAGQLSRVQSQVLLRLSSNS